MAVLYFFVSYLSGGGGGVKIICGGGRKNIGNSNEN